MMTGSWARRLALSGRFPILVKDLTEMAARKRTYVVRVVYAGLLFIIYALIVMDALKGYRGGGIYGIMGRGEDVFEGAMVLQFGGLFLFLPAMMSTAITSEKEREALPLIMLTGLRPWEILLEKYIGRMVPMAVFQLLGLPLVALAYSLGGVSVPQIVLLAYFLLLTMLQVGALSLMISAWCRTSVSAFIASYLVGAAYYFVLPLMMAFALFRWRGGGEELLLGWHPIYVLMEGMNFGRFSRSSSASLNVFGLLGRATLRSVPIFITIGFFLVMARLFLVQRAFLQPRNVVLGFFRHLDAFFKSINRITGGIVLVRDRSTFPAENPIFWRETVRKSLGKLNYLLRILLVIELPVLFICLIASFDSRYYSHDSEGLSVLLFFLWPLVALALVVRGADAVPSERSAQTLGVLLTTPMSGAQIIKEKMRAVRRLAVVGAVPLLTVIVTEWHAELGLTGNRAQRYGVTSDIGSGMYLLGSILTVAIYLPMLYWLGLFVGGKMRSRPKAIIAALIVLVLLCAIIPALLAAGDIAVGLDLERSPLSAMFLLSPVGMIAFSEVSDMTRDLVGDAAYYPVLLFANCIIYGGLWLLLRSWCLIRADAILGRAKEGPTREMQEPSAPADSCPTT